MFFAFSGVSQCLFWHVPFRVIRIAHFTIMGQNSVFDFQQSEKKTTTKVYQISLPFAIKPKHLLFEIEKKHPKNKHENFHIKIYWFIHRFDVCHAHTVCTLILALGISIKCHFIHSCWCKSNRNQTNLQFGHCD